MDHDLVMEWLKREDLDKKTISFAQNNEDILLARALSGHEGLYVDVGANHPVFHSVTKLFYDRGWTGINIEPSPPVFEQLQAARPHDVNLNVGVGDVAGMLTFYDTPDRHGWASFRHELADHYRGLGVAVIERPVPVRTLADVCAEHVGDRTIDFLKIDAEGFEQQVLTGMDFRRWRPRIVVVENFVPVVWEGIILGADYIPAAFDGLNRYFVRAEEPALLEPLRAPVNVLDNFVSHEVLRLIHAVERDTQVLGDSMATLHDLTDRLGRDASVGVGTLEAIRAMTDQRVGTLEAIRALADQFAERPTPRFSLIDALRHDGPRVAGKIRRMFRGVGGGRRAG